MKKLTFLFITICFVITTQSQEKPTVFKKGEWLRFKMSYSGFLKAGNATLSVDTDTIQGKEVILKENIKQKHKYALNDFALGDQIYMYGVLIGKAIEPIEAGCAITIKNVKHASAEFNDSQEKFSWAAPDASKFEGRTFNGYHREDGKVGTGNYWLVIPLTFCENRNIDVLEGALSEKLGYETKKDFAVDTDALINQYKAGASSEEIYSTPIITTKEEMTKNRVFPNVDGIKFLSFASKEGWIDETFLPRLRSAKDELENPLKWYSQVKEKGFNKPFSDLRN